VNEHTTPAEDATAEGGGVDWDRLRAAAVAARTPTSRTRASPWARRP
jgi:hypothetical protein